MNNDAMIEYWNGEAGQKWVDQSDHLDAMLAPFANEVLKAAKIQTGERALDIGCGAGALTLAATVQSGNQAGAIGVDVSAPLLDLARTRAAEAGSSARFDLGDASDYSASESLDLVISRFGVMFFEQPAAAFANIRAQIQPGGRMVFICWQALSSNDWAFAPLQAVLPLLKETPPMPDPTAPGPFAFADKDRVAGLLNDAGWQNVSINPFTTQMMLPGDNVATSTNFLLKLGATSRLIEEQGIDPQRVEAAVMERLNQNLQSDGRVAMKAACWLVRASA